MFNDLRLLEFAFWNDKTDIFSRECAINDIQGSVCGLGCFLFKKI
jgi:hypothetical protein